MTASSLLPAFAPPMHSPSAVEVSNDSRVAPRQTLVFLSFLVAGAVGPGRLAAQTLSLRAGTRRTTV